MRDEAPRRLGFPGEDEERRLWRGALKALQAEQRQVQMKKRLKWGR